MEDALRDFFANLEMGWLALLCLAGAALLEYLCPPFPGDMMAMVGAFLVGAAGWSAASVLTAIFVGSAVGMTLDYSFGVWVRHRDARWRENHRLWARIGQEVDRILTIYRRRPRTFLIVNRFLPSVRALFFVAAGMVETPPKMVALYGGVSMVAWALLLFGAGYWLGQDWEALVQFFRGFSKATWAIVLVAVVAYVLWRWVARRRESS